MKISVLGGGAFGYSLGYIIADSDLKKSVRIFDLDEKIRKSIREDRRHPYFHRDQEAPKNLHSVDSIGELLEGASICILAVPAQAMRQAVSSLKEGLGEKTVLLNVSKALEKNTNKRMSEVISEALGGKTNPIATLSGGMLAEDVMRLVPVGAQIACKDHEALQVLEDIFTPTNVHVESTTDIAGVEFGGAFKNVVSIGAGIVDGIGFGISSKAYFVSQALRELEQLAVGLGAREDTFHTASYHWMGDLMASCFGDSRNRQFGQLIGSGMSKAEAEERLAKEKKTVEGVATLELAHNLIKEKGMKSSFIAPLYRVIYEGADPKTTFRYICPKC